MIAALLLGVEIGTRILVRRLSRIEGRIGREYAAALRPPQSMQPVVWFLGNSLLDAAVDFPALSERVQGRMEARRFVVEQTFFHDWHYGIRKLFGTGTKPRCIVLMINGKQLVSNTSRGDYAAQILVAPGDIMGFVRDLKVHPTTAANLIFANFSMFYGLRSEIRKFVMLRLLPDLPTLTSRLVATAPPDVPDARFPLLAQQRIRILQTECARQGVRLIFAIPPSQDFETDQLLRRAVEEAKVEALMPFAAGDFEAAHFSDGFHLNRDGARRYTDLLGEALLKSAPWRVSVPD